MKQKVLFISSTGGHLSEMMQLKSMFNHYDYHIMYGKNKIKYEVKTTIPRARELFDLWNERSYVDVSI